MEGLHGQADSMSQEEADELEALLDQLLEALKDSLQEYIQDKHATHVPRRLLCVIAGRDVLPLNRAQPGKVGGRVGVGMKCSHGVLKARLAHDKTRGCSHGNRGHTSSITAVSFRACAGQ